MIRRRILGLALLCAAAATGCAGIASVLGMGGDPGPWDVLIRGGTVVDGTGRDGFDGDVAIRGGRIVRVGGGLDTALAARVLDATGRVVAPGFVDLHAAAAALARQPDAGNLVRQGITTALGGAAGVSPWPFGPHYDSLEARGIGVNAAYLVGHNTIRRAVMGLEDRPPTAAELAEMEERVARAMGIGAFGLATGRARPPGAFAPMDELVALARVAADSGGIYAIELRGGTEPADALAEAIEVADRAGVPVVITHHQIVGEPARGGSVGTLAGIDAARERGLDITLDLQPYDATYGELDVLVPAWALADGPEAFRARLRDRAARDSIVDGIIDAIVRGPGGGDLEGIRLARTPWAPELEGRTLADWARERRVAPVPEAGAELVIEALRAGGGSAVFHGLDAGDVERILRHPQAMVASGAVPDDDGAEAGDGRPHPRSWGAFPRVLGHFVRERGLLSLEEAVRKMTAAPARRLSLRDRGRIGEGMAADIVVFDPEAIADRATYAAPRRAPLGIDYVLVNGSIAVENGRFTGSRAGAVLRGWRYQMVPIAGPETATGAR